MADEVAEIISFVGMADEVADTISFVGMADEVADTISFVGMADEVADTISFVGMADEVADTKSFVGMADEVADTKSFVGMADEVADSTFVKFPPICRLSSVVSNKFFKLFILSLLNFIIEYFLDELSVTLLDSFELLNSFELCILLNFLDDNIYYTLDIFLIFKD